MIKLENICKTFKSLKSSKQVLDQISFSIEEGKITGFLGVNGSGKTTLIKTILQFISYDSGNITYAKSIASQKGGYQSIGYLPERPYYYTNLTGYEFLKFTVSLSRKWTKEVEKECFAYAEKLTVRDALERNLRDYSKGMLQKVGFISNLVSNCKLLILDEPLSGLDLISREEYKRVLVDYAKEGGSVFISSHIVTDLEEMANKIVLLDSKKIQYDGTSDLFFKSFETGEFELKVQSEEVIKSSCSEDKLLSELSRIEADSTLSLLSIQKKRKSFKDYIKEVRNEK